MLIPKKLDFLACSFIFETGRGAAETTEAWAI